MKNKTFVSVPITQEIKKKRKPTEKTKQSKPKHYCRGCGWPVHPTDHYCGECMVEDDCGY